MRMTCAILTLLGACANAYAGPGRIVLVNDEVTLSNSGFASAGASNVTNFVENVTAWFGGSNFLGYSNNFGLTGTNLRDAMANAGHTYSVNTSITFDVATLSTYDAVFLAGSVGGAPDNQVLIDYVNAGGNVYLAGGTGTFTGGPAGEATAWNTFLQAFDMEFASSAWTSSNGNIDVTGSSHPIFDNVSQLYQFNGSPINVVGPNAQLLVSQSGDGLYAVYDGVPATVIPLPTASALALAGCGVIAVRRRRPVA